MKAYRDIEKEDGLYRVFESDVPDIELTWHRDKKNRKVYVVSGFDWKFQYDNELPFSLKEGDMIAIDKMRYHRIIRGSTGLILRIEEDENE